VSSDKVTAPAETDPLAVFSAFLANQLAKPVQNATSATQDLSKVEAAVVQNSTRAVVEEVKTAPPKVERDELQEILNDYVLTHDFGILEGQCVFKLEEFTCAKTRKQITIGAHGCKDYGLNLQLYMNPSDWSNNLERTFKVTDANGVVLKQNNLLSSSPLSTQYTQVMFYLAPKNNRFGFMMSEGSRKSLANKTRWVYDP